MRILILAALPLALVACDSQPSAPPTSQAPSAFQNQVAALDDPQRNAVFIRAIRDAGYDCQQVTASKSQPVAAGGQPLWQATCSGGSIYGVQIGRDGTATVIGAK